MSDEISNNLRADLYPKIIPKIIEEDMKTGIDGVVSFWDDPNVVWDGDALWDEMGLLPVIKNLFFIIETEESKELLEIDNLRDLVNPNLTPEKFLNSMSESLGHSLEDNLTENEKRDVIKSQIRLNKIRGGRLSWTIFYRILGYEIAAYPLFKKHIYEEGGEYNREKYKTELVENETIGALGSLYYIGFLGNKPIKPGSVFIISGSRILRDEGNPNTEAFGTFISSDASGTVNYATGKFFIEFNTVTTSDLVASYEHVTNEYPFQSARVDLEIFIVPDDSGEIVTEVTKQLVGRLLMRLDEVRPIHVLLRAAIMVLDMARFPDIIPNFASDGKMCGADLGKDVRSDEYRLYSASIVNTGDEDSFTIEQSNLTQKHKITEDDAKFCFFPDTIKMEFSDRPTEYW